MIALTLQSVAKRVQDLIFDGKFWIERRLTRRHTRLAVGSCREPSGQSAHVQLAWRGAE